MPISFRRGLAVLALLGSAWFYAVASWASIEVYAFKDAGEEQRFQALIAELRCPKCQNQNLAGSDAPIAKDLKDRTFDLMQEGKSDNEIREYMIERYGDFITYKPPVRGSTYLLWFGPFALLLLVLVILVWRKRQKPAPAAGLSAEESSRLAALLKQSEHDE